MIGIELRDHCSDVVDGSPYGGIVARLETFHLVADTPQQQCRMDTVKKHCLVRYRELRSDLCGIRLVKAVSFMSQPDTDSHGLSQSMRFIQNTARVLSIPRTNRFRTGGSKSFESTIVSGAANQLGFATTQQLSAVFRLAQFSRHRFCGRKYGQQTGEYKNDLTGKLNRR